MIEADVEGPVSDWAEANGFLSRKMQYIGRHGCRDRDFYGYGHVIPVEFKRPRGAPRIHQKREIKRMADVGITIHVIDNVEAGIALLTRAMANPRSCDAF